MLDHLGWKGYGEAPAISYYNITVDKMVEDLERKKLFVEKFAFTEPDRYWHYLHHLFPNNPFLVCALDMAAWDLYGKIKSKPLKELWIENSFQTITDYTIGIDTIEKMLEKMQEKPWPVYKIFQQIVFYAPGLRPFFLLKYHNKKWQVLHHILSIPGVLSLQLMLVGVFLFLLKCQKDV
jgi:hypothetical protein